MLMMPKPDKSILARRAEIVTALKSIVPGEGVIDAARQMSVYESDGLTAYKQMPMVKFFKIKPFVQFLKRKMICSLGCLLIML